MARGTAGCIVLGMRADFYPQAVRRPELVQALTWNSNLHIVTGRAEEGLAAAHAGLAMAQALGIDRAVSQLLNTMGTCRACLIARATFTAQRWVTL